MRFLKLVVMLSISVCLIVLALANRSMVELNLLPSEFADSLGLAEAIKMPLFLVILIGVLIGLLIGFVWEYLREHKQRKELGATKKEVRTLAHEMKKLKKETREPQDEILELLDKV